MKARLGIAPIAWSNDDLPELGGDTPLEVCLSESREAGFSGTETGGKFPKDPSELRDVLAAHELKLVSGWYSGRVLENDLAAEKDRAHAQLTLFRENGAAVLVYGETTGTVQNKRDVPLAKRPRLDDEQMRAYGRKLTAFAEHCHEEKVPLAFHHHMATAIETEDDVNRLMNFTGEAVGLLFDTGHIAFAGGDGLRMAKRHGKRINHVHTKDVRRAVLEGSTGTASRSSTRCSSASSRCPATACSTSRRWRGSARRSATKAGSWSRPSRTRRRRTR